MIFKQCVRYFHITKCLSSANKSALGALRKKTGYSFTNCKKALELHENDVNKAEQWLKDQAQQLGWSKAMKVEGRTTKQGLIGVLINKNIGAMVEVNCETDFVARNDKFQKFVELVLKACVRHANKMPTNDVLSKIDFQGDSLKQLLANTENKTLADELALMIGNVGENATLRRALCYKATDALNIYGITHPLTTAEQNNTQLGKYGSIIAFKNTGDSTKSDIQKNICQHIVGMNPKKVGIMDQDEPALDIDNESCLIYQEYLLDPSLTMNELLAANNIEIVDFQRFECGENLEESAENLNIAKASN